MTSAARIHVRYELTNQELDSWPKRTNAPRLQARPTKTCRRTATSPLTVQSVRTTKPIERNPPFAELADALERAEDRDGAVRVRWLFCMPEPDDLRGTLAAAGLEEIRIDGALESGGRHGLIERNRGRAVRA